MALVALATRGRNWVGAATGSVRNWVVPIFWRNLGKVVAARSGSWDWWLAAPSWDNTPMETLKSNTIDPVLMTEMQERTDRAARGVRDPEAMRVARLRMDWMREEFRARHGEVDLAVELVRESRDKS